MPLYLSYLCSFFVVVPIIIGFIKRVFIDNSLKYIFILMLASFVAEALNDVLASHKINNMFVFKSFTIVEFTLLILFFKCFFDIIRQSYIHIFFLVFFFFVVAYDAFFRNTIGMIDDLPTSIESVVLISYSSIAFYLIMKKLLYENLIETSFFWMNSAILIYFGGNLFLFLCGNYLQKYIPPIMDCFMRYIPF